MDIIVESFLNPGEPSDASRRVRPLPGQGFSTEMRVECSKAMRFAYPVGQLFRLTVQLKSREGGPDFLYSYHGDEWRPVTRSEASAFIAASFGKPRSR
jgi:hypothetical protein